MRLMKCAPEEYHRRFVALDRERKLRQLETATRVGNADVGDDYVYTAWGYTYDSEGNPVILLDSERQGVECVYRVLQEGAPPTSPESAP